MIQAKQLPLKNDNPILQVQGEIAHLGSHLLGLSLRGDEAIAARHSRHSSGLRIRGYKILNNSNP